MRASGPRASELNPILKYLFVYTQIHMVKTISLADDAYEDLSSLKRHGESFSDVARRLASEHRRRRSIVESAGSWPMSEEEAERLTQEIYEARERSGEGRPGF